MRVALIHDWLNGMRGGEKVLEALCDLFPDATIYTLFYQPDKISQRISSHTVISSILDKIPGMQKSYRNLLPFYPKAMEVLSLRDFDLCISVSHSVAKGIKPNPGCLHICVCLTPMRYIWDRFDDYFGDKNSSHLKRYFAKLLCARLRKWDVASSSRVDLFVSISEFVQRRISKFYNRQSQVIYPFADTNYFTPGNQKNAKAVNSASPKGYFLVVSALVPYKRIREIVAAFRGLDEKVIIVGDGPDKRKLMDGAPPNVEFTGWVSDEQLLELYRNSKALLFPGVEDFGIVPVEAQACGKPVIALAEGGVLETVVGPIIGIDELDCSKATGVFFRKSTPEHIAEAVRIFDTLKFNPDIIRANALRFSRANFDAAISAFINESLMKFKANGRKGLDSEISQPARTANQIIL
jgi:glycosyltransferase involved in cell wall biosynthesis